MIASAKQLPKLKKRVLSSKQKQLHNFALGESGEQRVVVFLQNKGWHILETNFCVGRQEVDIIAWDAGLNADSGSGASTRPRELVFVEVKTRRSSAFGDPSLAVSREKLKAMYRVASVFLQRKGLQHQPYRFDVIAVLPDRILHYEHLTWEMVQ